MEVFPGLALVDFKGDLDERVERLALAKVGLRVELQLVDARAEGRAILQ